jgi:hypothetical protein
MRIQEILLEKKGKKRHHADMDHEEPAPDADQDKVPLITMQLLKALDVDGNYPITFLDGKRHKLHLNDIKKFLMQYMSARPNDKDVMQNLASQSLSGFHKALSHFITSSEPKHKIKGDRYMSSFAGDFDDK